MQAQFCPECGTALNEKGQCQNPDCKNYKAKEKPKVNIPSDILQKKELKKFSEKGKLIVPDCIKSDNDEKPIKQYDIARLQTIIKGAFAEGRLQVTNKRVIFRSTGNSLIGPTSLQHEFSIEEVAGIEIRKETKFNFFSTVLLLIASLIIYAIGSNIFAYIYNSKFFGTVFLFLLTIASIFFFFLLSKKHLARHIVLSVCLAGLPSGTSEFVSLILGQSNKFWNLSSLIVSLLFIISLLFLVFSPNLVVNIKTKGGTPSVEIRRKDGLLSFHHNDYTGFSQVLPGPDADLAMHELGAVIREVQQTGEYNG